MEQEYKLGAYVMILANAPTEPGSGDTPAYANGDCGHIVECDGKTRRMHVRLVRTGEVVEVPEVVRDVESSERPEDAGDKTKMGGYNEFPHRNARGKWVEGQVNYLPLRLAYATSVHKSQSLSLDRIQVDFRHRFFSSFGMVYVALSRCRTLEGLRLVGQKDVLAKHCLTDPRIARFL